MRQLVDRWRIDRLGLAQRIVLVVAFAFAVLAVGVYLMFLSSPGTIVVPSGFPTSGPGQLHVSYGSTLPLRPVLSPWEDLLVWIGLIGIWAGAGMWLLGQGRTTEGNDGRQLASAVD